VTNAVAPSAANLRATAAPMPRDAPVMTATRPASRPWRLPRVLSCPGVTTLPLAEVCELCFVLSPCMSPFLSVRRFLVGRADVRLP
jgi:hypothetical protein